ncbi:twin-arginine translocase TatA/TatE family subunit [Mangrovicoccus algicola]|uniref:Sec-independent protein translocase protein TatA n=1 Tax=Mangrovicoccus algicola TaxID=2771008 RepID=A0A8J6ZFI7_9RHOB|nr:twin-arginine translocase TatA/TatE family subunit [Mangrovicoccus algicola]MBE3640556.1 twin-arginine translocase TatA/TatE family subunit [Mangrovicoccus algicola]
MLNNIGPMGLILIAVVVLVLFGRGKVAGLMGEVGKGITSFKRGMKEGQQEELEKPAETRDVTPGEATGETAKDKV